MTLYEITREQLVLMQKINGTVAALQNVPEEEKDAKREELKALLDKDFNKKILGYVKFLKICQYQEAELAAEIKRLQERKKEISKIIKNTKTSIQESMLACGKKSAGGALFSVSLRAGKDTLVIDDEDKVPKDCLIPRPAKIDKNKLNEWAESHDISAFGHYEPSNILTIK